MLQHHQHSHELPQAHRPLGTASELVGTVQRTVGQSEASICMPKKAVLEGRSWPDNNCARANARQRTISE